MVVNTQKNKKDLKSTGTEIRKTLSGFKVLLKRRGSGGIHYPSMGGGGRYEGARTKEGCRRRHCGGDLEGREGGKAVRQRGKMGRA